MKISVKTPLMHDKIIALFDNNTISDLNFHFIEKKGIELLFELEGQDKDSDEVIAVVKKTIKDTDFGKGIYFSVVVV